MAPDENMILNVDVTTGDSVEKLAKVEKGTKGVGDSAASAAPKVDKLAGALDSAAVAAAKLNVPLSDDAMSFAELEAALGGATSSVEENTVVTSANTKQQAENTAAKVKALTVTDAMTIAQNRQTQSLVDVSIAHGAADRTFGPLYKKLTYLESMGTPAILKTATWGVLGVAGLAYEGVKQYVNFNKLITQTITQAGRKMSEMPFLSASVLQIAKDTGQSITDVANTLYRAASGTASWHKGLGATKKELVDIVRQISYLNVLGNVPAGAQTEQSARALTALVNSNMKDVGTSPAKAAALINATVGAGDIRQAELISAIGRGLLTAGKLNGVGAIDAMSWIDLLTSMGTTGSVAGNYVRTAVNLLNHPGPQGNKALAMIGIKPGQIEAIINGPGGLRQAAQVLADAVGSHSRFIPLPNFPKFQGSKGDAAAEKLLQSWGANNIPAKLIADWKAGTLTPAEDLFIKGLIFTKTFGGSRQMTPIATLIENTGRLGGIETAVRRNFNQKHYKTSVNIAESTPATEFHKLWNTVLADLINFGKMATPYALSLARGLTSFIGVLTKFKAVFLPLLAGFVGIMGLALTSKVAGAVKGLYPVFGASFKMNDKIFGGLSHLPGMSWLEHLKGKGGGQMRDAFTVAGGRPWQKIGDETMRYAGAVAQATVALERFTGAAVGGGSAMSGGGGGGGFGSPMGAAGTGGVTNEMRRVAVFENQGFARMTSEEYQVMKWHIENGKKMTKTSIRELIDGGHATGGSARARAIYDNLAPHLTGPGVLSAEARAGFNTLAVPVNYGGRMVDRGMLSVAERDVVANTERTAASVAARNAMPGIASLGGGLLSDGLASGVGSALGFLGGPIGMVALPMLMSTVVPSVMKFVSGWFKSAPPPPVTTQPTPKQDHRIISAEQAQLKALRAKVANGTASASDYAKYIQMSHDISTRRHEIAAFKKDPTLAYKQSSKSYNAIHQFLYDEIRRSYTGGGMFGTGTGGWINESDMGINGYLTSMSTKEFMHNWKTKIYPNLPQGIKDTLKKKWGIGINSNPGISTFGGDWNDIGHWMIKESAAYKKTTTQLGGTVPLTASALGKLGLSNATALQQLEMTDPLAKGVWSHMGLGKASKRFAYFENSSATARAYQIEDYRMSRNSHLDRATRAAYAALSSQMKADSEKLNAKAQGIAKKNGLNRDDLKILADLIASSNAKEFTRLGISPQGFANALASAINANGKGLASIVNSANASTVARNGG